MHDVIENGNLGLDAAAADRGALWRVWRNAFPFMVVGAIWEAIAHLGLFPAQFFPPLETIAAVFVRVTASGVLPHHAFDTLIRLTAGFALAAVFGRGRAGRGNGDTNYWDSGGSSDIGGHHGHGCGGGSSCGGGGCGGGGD